jgi:hypothetical protein
MIAFLAALSAHAQDECDTSALTEPPEALSVAWVSPLRKRAGANSWLYVVSTADLRTFADAHPDVGRTLQWLGMRRTAKAPRRQYKVVVFDTAPGELCRPVVTDQETLAGVVTCDESRSGPDGSYVGCGLATDRATGSPSVQLYRGQWRVLSVDGFCVLPLERFVSRE